MSFRLDQLLKASTVRVSTAGKAYEGMGFFFAPGLALTSAHVVQQAEGELVQVFLPGEQHAVPAEVKYRFPEEVGLVILQVQTTEAVPCAYLDADIKPGDQGYTFGCTGTSRKVHRVMLECEGMMGSAIGISHLAGRSKHLQLNGSPILNQRTGKVCGIVHTPTKNSGYRGEAVPMGVIFAEFPALSILQKEYHCQDNRWTTLLHPDLEALNADWSYYNKGWIRREQSIRAMLFLLRTASQWALIGARMRHVFPWRSIISLIKATFRGTLGSEIQRQYHQITRQLTSTIDPHSTSQARALHRLDAQSWVVSSLMEMLITPEQDYASSSRLLWMLEILQEQRVYVQTLKRMPGNFYPQLEEFKRRWKLLEHDDKYIDTSRVLSGLINRNTDTNFSLWYTIKFFLKDFVQDLAQNSKLSAHGLERLFNVLVVNLRHAVPAPTASVEDLLRDLEEEVRLNPDLKVLQKVQILMTSVSGEIVQGGHYRALKGSGTYHFSAKCKLYPDRAPAEELARIICYDTEAEARQQHKPCKNCLTAEKLLDRRLADWHDNDPTTPDLNAAAVAPVAVSNLITPDFRPNATTLHLPITDRVVDAAPAADAPMPETTGDLSLDRSMAPIVLEPLGDRITVELPVFDRPEPEVAATPVEPIAVEPIAVADNAVEPIAVADSAVETPVVTDSAVTAVEPTAVAAVEPTTVIDPAAATVSPTIVTTDLPAQAEAEHHDDLAAVSAQVEVELAAAIAEVAQEVAAEQAAQSQVAVQPQSVKQTKVPKAAKAAKASKRATAPEAASVSEAIEVLEVIAAPQPTEPIAAAEPPAVTSADRHALNTDTASDADDDEVFEMAAFFIPDGNQPAIELTETSAATPIAAVIPAETAVAAQPAAATMASSQSKTSAPETIVSQPEAVAAPPPTPSQAKTTSRKSTRAPKQTKTLKDFVAAISSANKIETKANAAKANQPTSQAPASPTKVAAKAAAQSSKSVKVSPAQPVADHQPETSTKTTKAKAAAKAIAAPPETAVSPVVEANPGITSTPSKAKEGKVTRLSDWVPNDAAIAPETTPANDPGVVSITAAKSARTKRQKAKSTTPAD
jgi:hypothetical protein